MANATSWAFPNIFNPVRNCVNVAEDNASITSRVRLLIKTEPTELYNSPNFGVGLKRYLWQYNTENTKAIIQDRIKAQLRMYEPAVDVEETTFQDGLISEVQDSQIKSATEYNQLKMTVGLKTIYGDKVTIDLSDVQQSVDNINALYTA